MAACIVDWADQERRLTDRVSVLVGEANGSYPSGNSVLVRGDGEAVIIDPSVTVVAMGGAPVRVDAMITSHGHEDHLPGPACSPRPGSTSMLRTVMCSTTRGTCSTPTSSPVRPGPSSTSRS